MEDIKNAIKTLEDAVVKLELSVHQSKKTSAQSTEKVSDLKKVIKMAYDRLDKVINAFQQGGGE